MWRKRSITLRSGGCDLSGVTGEVRSVSREETASNGMTPLPREAEETHKDLKIHKFKKVAIETKFIGCGGCYFCYFC